MIMKENVTFNGTPYEGEVLSNGNLIQGKRTAIVRGPNGNSVQGGRAVDGDLRSVQNQEPLWSINNSDMKQSLTVYFDNENDLDEDKPIIGSIALAMAADHVDRVAPRWVRIEANGGQYAIITLDPNNLLYNVYDLKDANTGLAFVNVEYLEISFPVSADANNPDWTNDYFRHDNMAGTRLFGIAEFQAFAGTVPEPATMTLLALGGLAMLRRNRR